MLAGAAAFSTVIIAVHIAAAIFAFGIVLIAPLLAVITERLDPAGIVWWHQCRSSLGRWVVNPGLTLVVASGVVLAFDEHLWGAFFVQWGLGASLVLGGLEGSFVMPQSRKLAAAAEHEPAGGAESGHSWGGDYLRRRRRLALVQDAMAVIVLVTVYLMTVQP